MQTREPSSQVIQSLLLCAALLCFFLLPPPASRPTPLYARRVREKCGMKTRSQTTPKPLNTVRLPPVESPRTRSRPKPKPETRKKGTLGDLRRPKKPPTAFFYFMEDFRKTFQEENPSVKAMQDVGKACGEKWNKMAFEEKVKYYDLATERRAEFEKAMAQYNKKKINGELSEESE
ncbi:hypothetical protein VPH35_044924 [Triticum aestivum]|nr:high mobility group B protein 14-like [Triticum aestivum]